MKSFENTTKDLNRGENLGKVGLIFVKRSIWFKFILYTVYCQLKSLFIVERLVRVTLKNKHACRDERIVKDKNTKKGYCLNRC